MTDPDRRVPMPPYFGSFQSQIEQQHAAKVSIGDDADELDDDDDDDPEDDPEDDDDPDDELDEEAARAELKKVRAALKKSNASAKRHRLKRRESEQQREQPKPKPKGGDDDEDVQTQIAAATAAERTKLHGTIKKASARAALITAGVDPDRVERALRQIDLDLLDVDDDSGEVDGIDEAIDDLRNDLPEWFARKRSRRSTSGQREQGDGSSTGGGSGRPNGGKNLSASEQQAALLLGNSR